MILLDVTIVNIAVPHIMTAFNVGISSIEWMLNVYVLVFAVLLITLGRLGDIYGRKILFNGGLVVFTLASLMCGLSPNFGFLLFSRGIQAIGAAAMMPATLSILNVTFSATGRGAALGIWGGVAGAANALGPILGGILINVYSWHAIFLVNVPVGILAFFAAVRILPNSTEPRVTKHIDYPGVVTVSVALFALTFALVEGQNFGWSSPVIVGLFALSLLMFLGFIFIERREKAPLVPLFLFRNRTFTAGNIVGLITTFGMLGTLFMVTLFLQVILGFSAIKAGVTLVPMPALILVTAPLAGRLTDRIGGRWILFTGMLTAALGIYLLSHLSPTTSEAALILPLAVTGLGIGMVMAPITTVVMASTPVEKSGAGAGILSTMRQVGSVLGISILGALLQNRLMANIAAGLNKVPEIAPGLREQILSNLSSGSLGAFGGFPGVPPALQGEIFVLFQTEFARSLNTVMYVAAGILFLGAFVALFVGTNKKGNEGNIPAAE